jgi:error-prone DNA polymerase
MDLTTRCSVSFRTIFFAITGRSMRSMTEPKYVELHAASAFSFLEAASQPEGLVRAAVETDMPAMALLDRSGFYGAARFHASAKQNGVRAHIGAEITVSELGDAVQPPLWLPHQYMARPARLSLLCASRAGYQNLCQLITRFKMREPRKCEGSATLDDLAQFSSGLLCMTGGEEGPLASALDRGGEAAGRACVERLVAMFGRGNVYVELQRHGDRAEEARNQAALRIAESLRLPILATNGVRYATQYEREVLDVFTSIRHHVSLATAGTQRARDAAPVQRCSGCDREYAAGVAASAVRAERSGL